MKELAPRLSQNEAKVLAVLAATGDYFGFDYHSFRSITRYSRLPRRIVRLSCRSLARRGFAEYRRGLWSEDGEPRGSGYAATVLGAIVADKKLVEKFQLRIWV